MLVGFLLFFAEIGFAQSQQLTTDIRFAQGESSIDPALDNNRQRLDTLCLRIAQIRRDSTDRHLRIDICSYASPEGGIALNNRLVRQRSAQTADYLRQNAAVADSLLALLPGGIAWSQLRQQVTASEMPYRNEVLALIDTVPEAIYRNNRMVDGRNHRLMALRGGVPYRYMMRYFFPALRYSEVVLHYDLQSIPQPDTVIAPPAEPAPQILAEEIFVAQPVVASYERRPLFALKTNLLFDAALTPNIEIEVPIGSRWSVNGEFMRGWWLRKQTFCWQLESFGVEGRYWFGDRAVRRQLTGWFAGVFASGGFYDFQFHRTRGVQGEFYLLAGVSGGYGMAISRSWSIEFSAGIGYIINNYRRYTVIDNDYLVRCGEEHRFQSIFPAKAKISLVWLIHRKVRKGGAR